jgi:hypothetical protein
VSIVRARVKSKKRWTGKNNGKPFSRNGRVKTYKVTNKKAWKKVLKLEAEGTPYTINEIPGYLLKRMSK